MIVRSLLKYGSCIAILFLCYLSASGQEPFRSTYDGDIKDMKAIESHMKRLYVHTLQSNECPSTKIRITVVDMQIKYQYSETDGLQKAKLIIPDADGIVTYSDGSTIILPRERTVWKPVGQSNNIIGGYTTPTYLPTRRIKSKTGYRKAEGYITLPATNDTAGIDRKDDIDQATGEEGSFNYFGIKRDGVFDAELGITKRTDTNGGWMIFHSLPAPDPPLAAWALDTGAGTIPDGTKVFLQLSVPADDQLAIYATWGQNGVYSHQYNCSGTKYDGSGNQWIRRNTTMVLHSDGKSQNNVWEGVHIATPSSNHLWVAGDTDQTTTDTTTWITVTETNQYYNEEVDILIDEYDPS